MILDLDLEEVAKNWIRSQEKINSNRNLKFFTMPSKKRIDILRDLIAPKVLNFYPQFAKKIWFN